MRENEVADRLLAKVSEFQQSVDFVCCQPRINRQPQVRAHSFGGRRHRAKFAFRNSVSFLPSHYLDAIANFHPHLKQTPPPPPPNALNYTSL